MLDPHQSQWSSSALCSCNPFGPYGHPCPVMLDPQCLHLVSIIRSSRCFSRPDTVSDPQIAPNTRSPPANLPFFPPRGFPLVPRQFHCQLPHRPIRTPHRRPMPPGTPPGVASHVRSSSSVSAAPLAGCGGGRVRVSKKARLRPWSAEALRSPTKTRRKRAIGRASLGVFVLKISQVSADKKNSQLMRIIGCPAPGAPVVPWCPNAVPYVFLFLRACQVHSGPLVLCGERNRFRFHPPIEYLPPTPKNRQTFFKKIFAPRTKGIVGPVDRLVVRWLGS